MDRRRFLRGAGTVGVGTALAATIPRMGSAAAKEQWNKTVVIYRLSTRGMVVCQACKGTAAHKYFRTHHVQRAHLGCNGRVLQQRISQRRWNRFFVKSNGKLRKVFDDRHGKS
jgi:hypothetical protein